MSFCDTVKHVEKRHRHRRWRQVQGKEFMPEETLPLSEGDQVIVRMRPGWTFIGELRAISDDAWQIYDFAVGEVLTVPWIDVSQIQRLGKAE